MDGDCIVAALRASTRAVMDSMEGRLPEGVVLVAEFADIAPLDPLGSAADLVGTGAVGPGPPTGGEAAESLEFAPAIVEIRARGPLALAGHRRER